MKPLSRTMETVRKADLSTTTTRLHTPWLILARGLWVLLVAFDVAGTLISFPIFIVRLHQICPRQPCLSAQLTPESSRVLQYLNLSVDSYATLFLIFTILLAVTCLVMAVVIFWRRSDNWMVLLITFALVGSGLGNPGTFSLINSIWLIPSRCLLCLLHITVFLVFALFPDGRFIPRWTRWLFIVWVLIDIGFVFSDAPFGLSHWPILLGVVAVIGFVGILISLLGAQIYRYRRVSDPVERQQTKWIVFSLEVSFVGLMRGSQGLYALPVLFPAFHLFTDLSAPLLFFLNVLLFFPLPLAFGRAILLHQLWDIDLIINRTLVYGILTLSVVGLYVLIPVGLGALFQAQGHPFISLFATVLIAVLFQPLRTRLHRAVNRLMFGERDEPYTVLSRLGQRLEATLAPDTILPILVETVAQALKLPYVAIGLLQDDTLTIAASFGRKEADTALRLPLVYQTEHIGELLLAARSPGEAFTPADLRLLDDLARQAGVAVHAVRLTTDLKHSRERLVAAREEERRRLRRDLHDGLGPQLASQILTLTVVRRLLRQEPDTAEALLAQVMVHAQDAINDIRRLVYALRPLALDDLGLPDALREQFAQYQASGITFTLEIPEPLPPLSAAVEVACYRIVQEAVTNVVRHAKATICTTRISVGEALCLEITDNGIGLPPIARSGVGLTSMSERATELGGTCVIEPLPTGGTRVGVSLPLS
jgi:signal transduction histidine kinase